MIFIETKLKGAFMLVEAERLEDERGFFARTWRQGQSLIFDCRLTISDCC